VDGIFPITGFCGSFLFFTGTIFNIYFTAMGRKRKPPTARKGFRISEELNKELDIFFLQHRGIRQGAFAEEALRAELGKRGHLWVFPQNKKPSGLNNEKLDASQESLNL
jgi:hypothetical protein